MAIGHRSRLFVKLSDSKSTTAPMAEPLVDEEEQLLHASQVNPFSLAYYCRSHIEDP